MIDTATLQAYAADYGVTVPDEMAVQFDAYADLLVDWNQRMNLTAITAPEAIVLLHFVDSLTAAPLLPSSPFSLIDVGAGAGFPSLPLKILRNDMKLTMLDSLNKRLLFLTAVCEQLGLKAETVHARAEEGGRNNALRERFDIATARAVASLPTLCEYCLPFVKVGGRFIAMKGPDGAAELEKAGRAIALLGGRVCESRHIQLPNRPADEIFERELIVIEKVCQTPALYPRHGSKIAKLPL